MVDRFREELSTTQLQVSNPFASLMKVANKLVNKPKPKSEIHLTAIVGENPQFHSSVSIGAYCVIGNDVTIGEGTVLFPHSVVYDGAEIGKNCTIHSHAVIRENLSIGNSCVIQNGSTIGTDGFGYIPDADRGHVHIPHIGSLILEDEVEIGANSSIDRGTLGTTVIGSQSKIDNLVQIGHNNKIGKRTLVCGQVGIGGSCEIGSDVVLAGCVGVADHMKIDDGVRTAGMTGISRNLTKEEGKANTDYAGLPPVPIGRWRRQMTSLAKLPDLLKEVRKLGKRVEKIERSE